MSLEAWGHALNLPNGHEVRNSQRLCIITLSFSLECLKISKIYKKITLKNCLLCEPPYLLFMNFLSYMGSCKSLRCNEKVQEWQIMKNVSIMTVLFYEVEG